MLRCTICSKRQFCESYRGHRNGLGRRGGRLAAGRTLAVSVAALSLPAALASQEQPQVTKPSPWTLCAKATNLIERQEGVPRQLLRAISKVESGRFHQKKRVVMAWPWTVMAEGRGRYLPTKAAAIAEVEGLKARGIRNIDVGLPRRESKMAPGYKGFLVEGDPLMTIEEAARRRDFTVNAISWDPLTGEYFDPANGRRDLDTRIL